MTTKRPLSFLFSLLSIPLFALACQNGESAEPAGEEPAAAEAPASDVTYEPAYPTDVSEEGLSEGDTAQQQATHSHGGDEHSHAEGEDHPHGEDEDHPHGEGEGEHSHGAEDDDGHEH